MNFLTGVSKVEHASVERTVSVDADAPGLLLLLYGGAELSGHHLAAALQRGGKLVR